MCSKSRFLDHARFTRPFCRICLPEAFLVSPYPTRIRLDELLPLVYDQLRVYASKCLRDEPLGLTLQTTDLVHEVYLRLSQLKEIQWNSDNELLRAAVGVMRRVLVDHARARRSAKRSATGHRLSLQDQLEFADSQSGGPGSVIDLLDLDNALVRLAEVDERKAEVVQMRYFGGFSIEEVAGLLEVSEATVKRDWMLAKAWLYRELHGDSASQS